MDITNRPGVLSGDRLVVGRRRTRYAGRPGPREPYWRPAARFAVAAAVAGGLCWVIWLAVPRTLTGQTAIMGYPTFANFGYQPLFWAWRLTVYGLPLFMITTYSWLAWRGPLRRIDRPSPRRIRLADQADPIRTLGPAATVCRVALPTLVVVVTAASRAGRYDWRAVLAGLGYLVLVGVTTVCMRGVPIGHFLASRDALPPRGLTRASARGRGAPTTGRATLSLTNGVAGAVAALLGLWFVAAHTWVVAAGVRYPMPWLPWWLSAAGVLGVLAWALRRTRRGLSTCDTERRLLVLVGAVAVFLATSVLPGSLTTFRGFDDALELAGSTLVQHGLVPWRDFLFMHGLFPDVVRGEITTAVFGRSAWALPAGLRMLFTPATWVFVYALAAWASRVNAWVLAAVFAVAVSGFAPTLETRFVFVPLSLIVLGVALRHRSRVWSAILVLVLLAQAVLVPETSFLALPALACVVAADLLHHREPGRGLWPALRMSRWCAVAGVVGLAALAAGLASIGALRGFVRYYRVVGQGHNLTGAIPPTRIGPVEVVQIATGAVLILLTIWLVTARVRRRGDWQPADWVMVAAAAFVALYGEKFLGHFDNQHVWQFATVELSLVALWLWQSAEIITGALARLSARPRRSRRVARWRTRAPALVGATSVILIAVNIAPSLTRIERQHQVLLADPISPVPGAGFVASPTVIDPALVGDLNTVLRTYAGSDQPVFDLINSPGYVDFLLGRVPATQFDPIAVAIPLRAQQLVVAQLKRSRPPVVLFDSSTIGVPVWDGIANNVRHYFVSEYILDGYVPLMLTHGNLILLRRDLMKPGTTLPTLQQTPTTTDLWYGRPCDWGYAPDFMPTVAHGASVRLPATPLGRYRIDSAWGWAVDPATGQGASTVLETKGGRVVASFTPDVVRADLPTLTTPVGFAFSRGSADQSHPGYYVLSANGTAYPLRDSSTPFSASLQLPDGQAVPTLTTTVGRLEAYGSALRSVAQLQVPAGTDLGHYPLATVETRGTLANGSYEISNLIGDPHHSISFNARSDAPSSLGVQVGACTQWHGFSTRGPLYVEQAGGNPVTSVVLSGVRN